MELQIVLKNFEGAKKINGDLEYWSARDLMGLLGYSTWRKFNETIKRAQQSCLSGGNNVNDHFVGSGNMIETGKGAQRKVEDYLLTRYASYLVAQNGDPRKPEIALAQTYFATQTRRQELMEIREKENRRIETRHKLKETERKIESTVYKRGISKQVEFATFKNSHIEALYGGISISDLKKKRKIPSTRSLADFDTHVELKAKDFSLAMTDHNIKEKNLKGHYQMTEEIKKNGKATRQTLLSRGIRPETLQPEEDIKKIESRRNKEKALLQE